MPKTGTSDTKAEPERAKDHVDEDAQPVLSSAKGRLLASAKQMARAQVDSLLQSEILTSLIDGRRTLAELVEHIYAVRNDNPDYQMYYARVRRATKNLSSKGLVSEGIIRKDRPYRLTKYGVSKLLQIGEPAGEYGIVSWKDYLLFLLSGLLLGWLALARLGFWPGGEHLLKILYSVFFVSAGAGLLRLWQILRNVL